MEEQNKKKQTYYVKLLDFTFVVRSSVKDLKFAVLARYRAGVNSEWSKWYVERWSTSQELAETLVEAALSGSLPTVQLGIDLEFEKRKVVELKAYIDRLIEAGEKMQALIGWSTGDEATKDWDALVKDWKECEK